MSFLCNCASLVFHMLLICAHIPSVCHTYVLLMSLVCSCMSSVCHLYVLICQVCHSYALVCYLYVTRTYSYVTRMSLICTMNPKMHLKSLWVTKICLSTLTIDNAFGFPSLLSSPKGSWIFMIESKCPFLLSTSLSGTSTMHVLSLIISA